MSTSPAGWQPDPRGRHEYRYWDGSKWTDHVSDKGVVSSDPVADEAPAAAAAPATEVAPAATPADVAPETSSVAEPEPVPAADPAVSPVAAPSASGGGSAPPPGGSSPSSGSSAGASASAAAETAKAQAREALTSKSPDLALLLSVIAPGSGHLYLGVEPAKRNIAFGLLGATVVAIILAYLSFITFIIGFVIWAGAAYFAVNDLRGGTAGLENTSIPQQFVGILLTVAGVILVISLFLPYYHVKATGGGISVSGNVSGFDAFDIIDIILLIIGLLAIAGGVVSMGIIGGSNIPAQLPMAVAIGGAVALVLIYFRMFVDSAPDFGDLGGGSIKIGRAPGILLAADAAIILVMANLSALKSLRK